MFKFIVVLWRESTVVFSQQCLDTQCAHDMGQSWREIRKEKSWSCPLMKKKQAAEYSSIWKWTSFAAVCLYVHQKCKATFRDCKSIGLSLQVPLCLFFNSSSMQTRSHMKSNTAILKLFCVFGVMLRSTFVLILAGWKWRMQCIYYLL